MTVSQTPQQPTLDNPDQVLQQAANFHQAGQLDEAEVLYRRLLAANPGHPDANHNLGILAIQRQQADAGVLYFKAALDARPEESLFWTSYIDALIRTGQQDLARQVLELGMQRGLAGEGVLRLAERLAMAQEQQAVPAVRQEQARQAGRKDPGPQEINALMSLFNRGRFGEAETLAKSFTLRFPRSGFGWKALGAVLQLQGRTKEAIAPMQTAAQLLPGDVEVLSNLGAVLHAEGRFSEAEASLRRAIKIKPIDAEAHNNLGNSLKGLGRLPEAEACFRKAVQIKPNYADAYCNLGAMLQDQGRLSEAEVCLRRALEHKPDYAEAHNNLGNVLKDRGLLSEAEQSFRQALELKADYAEAHCNLGVTLQDQGRHAEAEASLRRALELKPDYEDAFSNLLFVLNYAPDKSAETIFDAYREYDARFGKPLQGEWQAHGNSRDTQRRLKVGYVSPDFRRHAVRHFLEPLLAHHDKTAFELYAYAELSVEDEVTARYRGYVDHFIPTGGMGDAALAERIRADGIDILVDLAGHTARNRLGVFARKPAPVSLSWLGYGYTTGLSAIDYLLTDNVSAPPGSEHLFSEQPWWVPVPGYAYRPAEGMGEAGPLPALQRGHVTFGTLTRAVRINHRTIRVWSEILKRVPGSRLVIDSGNFIDPAMQEALAVKFGVHGIDRERLSIGYHTPPWDVLRAVDIGLDCFPHNSGTTLIETLYMGIPYVTLAGRPSVGRLGSTILEGAGHPEWIAGSEEEYVDKAVALASDLPTLAALRAGLRGQLQASALMDEAGFARKVETAYRAMFEKFAGKDAAAPIAECDPHEINALIGMFNQGRLSEAETQARSLTERFPDLGFGWKALGALLQLQGRIEEALPPMQRAALLLPEDVEAQSNLGVTLQALGHIVEAEASYRAALRLHPGHADAHCNLGVILQEQGRHEEAEACLRRAIELKPDYPAAYYNLGNSFKDREQLLQAEQCFRQALELKPDYVKAHCNLGVTLQDQGRHAEAEASLRRALELKPDYEDAFSNLLFVLNYAPDKSAETIFDAYREYDARFGKPLQGEWQAHGNSRDTQRRLKVGYVSPDFRRHAVRHFLEPLLAHHDKTAFELYAYAELSVEDEVTARYRGYVDHFIPTGGMGDAALAERIRADGIDILVDLAGHTARNRLGVFARKPAPVSLSWLGYGYTTGLSAIDYLLTDNVSAPPGSEHLFSEQPWWVPVPGYAYRPAEGMGEAGPLPALQRGHVTFGTLTRAVRINHRTIRVWSEILKRVPGSRLVIDSGNFIDPAMQEALAVKFGVHGIDRERLSIGYHTPPWDVLRAVDIGLDCFPHNSGTTLIETLYMGIPYVTLAGRPSVGRLGSTILEGAGHPEWIAGSEEEYVDKAVALASDLPTLAALRAGLRGQLQASALMDEAGFARKVETAFRDMFEKFAGKGAEPATAGRFASAPPRKTGGKEPGPGEINALVGLFNQGRLADAEALARSLTKRFPQFGFGWKAFGAVLQMLGRIEDAVAPMQRAAQLLPRDIEVHSNLGVALQACGRSAEAEETLRRALKINAGDAETHNNLGNALKGMSRLKDAEASYRSAIRLKPRYADAHCNLGAVLHAMGRLADAEAYLRQALELRPDYAVAYFNLGNVLNAQYRIVESAQCYRHAVELDPKYAQAHRALSLRMAYLSDYREVVAESDIAQQLKPDDPEAWEQRLYAFSYHPDLSAEQIFSEFAHWGSRFAPPVVDFSTHDRNPARRLRIGYVSPDFRRHTSRFFFWPFFSNHDRTAFELYAYSNVEREDEFTGQFKELFDHWRDIRGVSDDQAAKMVRDDHIDILVDCCNHMMDDRLGIFARKPAPIQATWLGAAWTTGLKTVDYVLSDPYMAPEGTLTSETIVRLPHFFVAFNPPEITAEIVAPPCIRNGFVSFGYSGRSERLNHRTFRVWGEILQRLPSARLILDFAPFADPATQEYYRTFMSGFGVDTSRVIMRKSANIFEGLNEFDILLDCFPHSGGTMLFDALWMGVPALTMPSRPPVGRIGTSLMMNLGLPEWVVTDENDYIDKACAFAGEPQRLTELRTGMRDRMRASPVMDGAGFARGVEDAYRRMFRAWSEKNQ
ncbi:tetratricopeptide repeat protein [Herbaspirillum sp. ST 5-3]|uniref:tetratricopeptide repeat protein n=1 Tax=Oxalobacteraceae TaxID=75682 RepID=UPI0010A2E588|nr:tetratricopeptide repeat protein [Herbaspirillum sp. ST 5-3]